MNLTLISAPPMPVSLDEVRLHCRIDHSDEDDYLNILVSSAHLYAEHYCQRSFGEQTWRGNWWDWPKRLPKPPLVSVSEIRFWRHGEQQVLDPSEYRLDLSMPGRVLPVHSFPIADDRPDAVEITWVAGHEASENVRLACLIMVSHWYQVREPVVVGTIIAQVPWSANALLDRERWGDYS